MGLFDSLFGKSRKPAKARTLVVIDWDRVQHLNADLGFIQQQKNPLVWIFYKTVAKTDQWKKIQPNSIVTPKQIPNYESNLGNFITASVVHEVATNGPFHKVLLVTTENALAGLAGFLKSKSVFTETLTPGRARREERDRDRGERRDRPERGERGERRERPERGERQDRGERRERPERNERQEREPRPERQPRPEREPRSERQPRPEKPAPATVITESAVTADAAPVEAQEPRTTETINQDIQVLVESWAKTFSVGEEKPRSVFGGFIKQATGKNPSEIFGVRSTRPFVDRLIQVGVLEVVDEETCRVLRNLTKLPLIELAHEVPLDAVPEEREGRRRGSRGGRGRGRGRGRDGERAPREGQVGDVAADHSADPGDDIRDKAPSAADEAYERSYNREGDQE